MIPKIHELHSPDVADLAVWVPARPETVHVLLELTIGPVGVLGGDLFQVVIATPEALRAHLRTDFLSSLHGYMVVLEWDWQQITMGLERIVARCQDVGWEQVAKKLSRFFLWEFEDYQPYEMG